MCLGGYNELMDFLAFSSTTATATATTTTASTPANIAHVLVQESALPIRHAVSHDFYALSGSAPFTLQARAVE